MQCFNCGSNTDNSYLCEKCHTEQVLDKIYSDILSFKYEKNEFIKEYVSKLENPYLVWDCIPTILETFDANITEYYYCHYYKITKKPNFEELAKEHLKKHNELDIKTQGILYDIVHFYLRDDYINPKKWCDLICKSQKDLAIELYNISAEYYSMIGEYELSNQLIDKGLEVIKNKPEYIFSNDESMTKSFERLKGLLNRYKSGNPYWPVTEERRRKVAEIYDQKGIKYPRIELRPEIVKEEDFKPINEVYDELSENYVCFWCAETYNVPEIKCIYQIGAVKINDNKIIDEYQSYIKPWDGAKAKARAAKKANIGIEEIKAARDVDFVIKEFLEFIENYTLVSTDALGSQAKLFIRALRYSGIKSIDNGFFDILDYATNIDSQFDLENNNREFLLK